MDHNAVSRKDERRKQPNYNLLKTPYLASLTRSYIRAVKGLLQPTEENTNVHLIVGCVEWSIWSQTIPWNFDKERRYFTRNGLFTFITSAISLGVHAILSLFWFYAKVIAKSEGHSVIWKQVIITYFTAIFWLFFVAIVLIPYQLVHLIPLLNFLIKQESRCYNKGKLHK